MMKSAENGRAASWPEVLYRPMARRILGQRQMRSQFVAIAGVGCKDETQVGHAEDHDVIDAFSPDRADQPLHMSVLPG